MTSKMGTEICSNNDNQNVSVEPGALDGMQLK